MIAWEGYLQAGLGEPFEKKQRLHRQPKYAGSSDEMVT